MPDGSPSRLSRRQVLAALGSGASAVVTAGCTRADLAENPGRSATSGTPTPRASAITVGGAWPQFGFDARNTGYTPTGSGPTSDPSVEWRFDAGTPTMNSSPVIGDGTIYVAGSGDPGHLHAVDPVTGESDWRVEPAGYVTCAPALVDGTLYFGTWGKRFYGVDTADGEELWSRGVGHRFGSSSPVVVDGTIYVGTLGDGPLEVSGSEDEEASNACAVLALDAGSGDEQWRFDEFGGRDWIRSSPAVAHGRVYVSGEEDVCALDAESGDLVWRRDVTAHAATSPATQDGLVFVAGERDGGTFPATVWALDAETGDTVWSTGVDDQRVRASPAVADGTVYVAASSSRTCLLVGGDDQQCAGVTRGRLYALDAETGDRNWHAPIETDTRSAPAVADGMIYVGCRNGLSAVTTDGDAAWRIDFQSERDDETYVDSSPAVGNGRVVVGASDGVLRAVADGPSTD